MEVDGFPTKWFGFPEENEFSKNTRRQNMY